MTDLSIISLADVWLVFGALGGYQLYLQHKSVNRERYCEGFIKRLQYLLGVPALGSLFVFLADPDQLSFVFIELPRGAETAGIVLFNGAALIILWSHLVLGRHWSGDLETLSDHRLVNSGPYSLVRHPLYSSYLFLTAGFLLMTENWLVSTMMFVYFLAVAARARTEEEMLATRIGAEYRAYCARTPRFLPSVGRVWDHARSALGPRLDHVKSHLSVF